MCNSPALDRVNRQFRAPAPNALWLSDFTYVATWQGFVYVAFVIDAFARCRIQRRPPRLDMTVYPYLPRATVAMTSARAYMDLLTGGAS